MSLRTLSDLRRHTTDAAPLAGHQIVCENAAKRDGAWLPYTYDVVVCKECRADSGYRKKRWLTLFYFVDEEYVCNGCRDIKGVIY